MAFDLRIVTLVLAALSFTLNLAIFGCAAHALSVFNSQNQTNVYFLPLWTAHFDMRELPVLIGTSVTIVVLSAVIIPTVFTSARGPGMTGTMSAFISVVISLAALVFSAALNQEAPGRDTLQSWTCKWMDVGNNGVPQDFGRLCQETRFAFYTTIPGFIIQLGLLSTMAYIQFSVARQAKAFEFQEKHDHELADSMRNGSVFTRSEASKSQVVLTASAV